MVRTQKNNAPKSIAAEVNGDEQFNPSKPCRGLSDELIVKIYEQVYAIDRRAKKSLLPLPGLREILVSRRIYAAARPVWLHTIEASSSGERVDIVLAGLLRDQAACLAIRKLDLKIFETLQYTTAAMLARLPNLEDLKISFDSTFKDNLACQVYLDPSLLNGIAQLPRLRQLGFNDAVYTPADFPTCIGPVAVEHLELSARDKLGLSLKIGQLPWASLRKIDLEVHRGRDEHYAEDVVDFLTKQLVAYEGPCVINRVRIRLLDPRAPLSEVIASGLAAFAPRGATSFRFTTTSTAAFLPIDTSRVDLGKPKILVVDSGVPYNLTKQRNFAQLLTLIKQLSTLETLKIHGLVADSDGTPLEPAHLVDKDLVTEYPMLFALLSGLAQTSVTTFTIKSEVSSTKRFTWGRQSREEPFKRK
ncbi:hypothetical protein JCM10908_006314 [Rhodotorula pacifica]|uniref:uncharacterized protein n=1 Tax=Rhodotorula pacifica TaxID=1495444 RepID=UPI003178436D